MDKFENKKIAIIGGGHMGQALVQGLINSGKISGSQLIVANPSLGKIIHLKKQGVKITSDNRGAVTAAEWIFLAVKPSVIGEVLVEISGVVTNKLLISLAAVVSLDKLRGLVKHAEVIRVMPNMTISCNQGAIGFYAGEISGQNKLQVKKLLTLLGMVVEVEKEEDLDALTLLSGCGSAIVAQFMEMLTNYGLSTGFSLDKSRVLALQTFKGTVRLVEDSGISAARLVQAVATKGGITETILKNLKQNGFQNRFIRAMDSGYTRIRELQKKSI